MDFKLQLERELAALVLRSGPEIHIDTTAILAVTAPYVRPRFGWRVALTTWPDAIRPGQLAHYDIPNPGTKLDLQLAAARLMRVRQLVEMLDSTEGKP